MIKCRECGRTFTQQYLANQHAETHRRSYVPSETVTEDFTPSWSPTPSDDFISSSDPFASVDAGISVDTSSSFDGAGGGGDFGGGGSGGDW